MSTISKPPSISAAEWAKMTDAQKKAVVYERTTTGTDERGAYTRRDTRQKNPNKTKTTKTRLTWDQAWDQNLDGIQQMYKDKNAYKTDMRTQRGDTVESQKKFDAAVAKATGVEGGPGTKVVETDATSVSAWQEGEKVYNPGPPTKKTTTPKVPTQVAEKTGIGKALENDPGAFGQIAKGLAKTAGSLVGGGARRREQRAATKELAQRKQAYEDFEMRNVYEDLTNPYEDLKVNTQEAEFMAQQSQQGLANTLGALSATAGGSGIAALAQTMVGQQAMNIQRAGASIGMQESRNEALRAQGAERTELRKAMGASEVQQFELGRTETLLDMAAVRKKEADDARKQATQDLVGGIADTVVGVGRVAAAAATGGTSEAAISAGGKMASTANKVTDLKSVMDQKRAIQSFQSGGGISYFN